MKSSRIILLCTLLLGVFVVAMLVVGTFLSAPRQTVIGAPPTDLPVQRVSFSSDSGTLVKGWFLSGEKEKGGIILMHGVRSNRLQMVQRARFLFHHGYSVLLFDFQSHGESTGKNITFGYLESMDAEAAFSFLVNRLENKSVGIIGVSLGGAAALIGQVVESADAIVLESVYPSIEEAISNRLAIRLGPLGRYLVPLLTVQMKMRLGITADALRPINHMADANGAVFVISGDRDRHTMIAESKRLFEAAPRPKHFWAVQGAGHIDMCQFNRGTYHEKILWFFDKYLKS